MKQISRNNPYTMKYYLKECDGFSQFSNSKGKVLGKRLKKMLKMANIKPGEKVLDIGCGRGELVLQGSLLGAKSYGTDNSSAAIEICRQTRQVWEKKNPQTSQNVLFLKTEGSKLPFRMGSFDAVWLSDIVEHLSPYTLSELLCEVFRVSKKNSRLLIHTSPNKYYIPLGGRLMALLFRIFKILRLPSYKNHKSIPWDIRKVLPPGLQTHIHINELSRRILVRMLRKNGFLIKKIWFELNPHYLDFLFPDSTGLKVMGIIKKIFPVKHIFFADLYCIASPKSPNFSTQQREQMGNRDKY